MAYGFPDEIKAAANMLQNLLIETYENNCPISVCREGNKWWSGKLMKLREQIRRDFNRKMRSGRPEDVERFKTAQRKYKEAIREAKKLRERSSVRRRKA